MRSEGLSVLFPLAPAAAVVADVVPLVSGIASAPPVGADTDASVAARMTSAELDDLADLLILHEVGEQVRWPAGVSAISAARIVACRR